MLDNNCDQSPRPEPALSQLTILQEVAYEEGVMMFGFVDTVQRHNNRRESKAAKVRKQIANMAQMAANAECDDERGGFLLVIYIYINLSNVGVSVQHIYR